VFVGGCELEAAEAVCDFDSRLGLDVLEGISSLIENSLLIEQDDPGGEPRYSMLETIRDYASEQLEASGGTDALRRRHADYFSALAARGERTVHYHAPAEPEQQTMTRHQISLAGAPEERAQRELPNLRTALTWTFDKGEVELALRLAEAASWGWALSSAYSEGRDWVAHALKETEHLQTLQRARALFWLAEFAGWQGDLRSAKTFNEQARALFEQHHDQIGVFRSLLGLTQFEVSLGDLEGARVALENAGTLASGLASDYERVFFCFKAAQVEGLAGDYEQAQALQDEALQLCRKLGMPRRQWVTQLINVGWFALEQHDFVRARTAFEEYLAEDAGKTPRGIANAHCSLGLVALYQDDREDATLRFRMALTLARDASVKPTIATALYGLAALAAISGDVERSVRLCGHADEIRQSTGAPLTKQEQFVTARYLGSARARLASDALPTARSGSGSTRLDEALAYALEQHNAAPGH
jgi:tetratricopeptide (TPR) repeat protein